jgi:hypothetical protein
MAAKGIRTLIGPSIRKSRRKILRGPIVIAEVPGLSKTCATTSVGGARVISTAAKIRLKPTDRILENSQPP